MSVSSPSDLAEAMRQNNTNIVFDLTAAITVNWPRYPYIAIETAAGAVILSKHPDIHYPSLQPGDLIRAKGYVGPVERIFSAAYCMSIEVKGHNRPISSVRSVSFSQFNGGEFDARRVRVVGHIIDVFHDELDPVWVYLVLSDGKDSIYVALPPKNASGDLLDLINHDVSVSGLCNPNEGGARHHVGRMLIAPDETAIQILSRPNWWTTTKLVAAIGILSAALLGVMLWNLSLRVLVERRSHALFREQLAHASAELRTEERTRLAVELHDSIAQNLTGVSFQINAARRIAESERSAAVPTLTLASQTLQSCRSELRNCLWDLRNQALDEPDVSTAIWRTLHPYLEKTKLTIRFNVPRKKLTDNTLHALLRIIRELVSNGIVHGHAKNIRIAGGLDGKSLVFSVRDDGCGFDPDNVPGSAQGHFGLQGIRERVRKLSGLLKIESSPNNGCKTTVRIS